jgi:hypothetical protein
MSSSVFLFLNFNGKACGKHAKLTFVISAETDLVSSFTGTWTAFDESGRQGHGTLTGVPDVGGDYVGEMRC